MNNNTFSIDQLARQTQQGNKQSESHLRGQLENGLYWIVRRFLETGDAPRNLAKPLRDECRRVAPFAAEPDTMPRYLKDQMARNLCDRMIERLKGRSLTRQASLETVVL